MRDHYNMAPRCSQASAEISFETANTSIAVEISALSEASFASAVKRSVSARRTSSLILSIQTLCFSIRALALWGPSPRSFLDSRIVFMSSAFSSMRDLMAGLVLASALAARRRKRSKRASVSAMISCGVRCCRFSMSVLYHREQVKARTISRKCPCRVCRYSGQAGWLSGCLRDAREACTSYTGHRLLGYCLSWAYYTTPQPKVQRYL